jgi:hypothetical protein
MGALIMQVLARVPVWVWPVALGLSVAAGAGAHLHGRAQAATAHAALQDLQRETAQAATRASEAARQKETKLLATTQAISDQLNQEKRRAQDTQSRLVADIRAGTQRLSIAARCPSPAGQAGADTATAQIDGADTPRAELDPTVAEALVAIAADGDTAIAERNACIAAYNQVRDTLNATPGP